MVSTFFKVVVPVVFFEKKVPPHKFRTSHHSIFAKLVRVGKVSKKCSEALH